MSLLDGIRRLLSTTPQQTAQQNQGNLRGRTVDLHPPLPRQPVPGPADMEMQPPRHRNPLEGINLTYDLLARIPENFLAQRNAPQAGILQAIVLRANGPDDVES